MPFPRLEKVIYHETIQTVETPFSEILLLDQESPTTIVRFIRFLGGLRDRFHSSNVELYSIHSIFLSASYGSTWIGRLSLNKRVIEFSFY